MKVLVIVRHVLFLRFLEPVIEQLLAVGHEVEVGYTAGMADEYAKKLMERPWARNAVISVAPLDKGWMYRGLLFLRLAQDYLRYLDPVYDASPGLRYRAATPIPRPIRQIFRLFGARFAVFRWGLIRLLRWLDQSLPCNPAVNRYLGCRAFDILLITPLVDPTSGECEYLKCAINRGGKSVLMVASWDNLTNKGLVQFEPDRILVWNRWVAREAMTLHRLPENKIRIVGAPVFDTWFSMHPSCVREELIARLGLDSGWPIILYLCSSGFIASHEIDSIMDWLKGLRSHPDDLVRNAGVLIRPHPGNPQDWTRLSAFENIAVCPPNGEQVLDEVARARYFDSMYYAKAIVAINTSGMIEAGIVGRPVLMLSDMRTHVSQEGTLHFRLLVENGLIQPVTSEGEHFKRLADYLSGQDPELEARGRFIGDFVHPHGWNVSAAKIVVNELEDLDRSC